MLLLALALIPAPASANALPPLRPGGPPYFTADPVLSLAPDGHPTLVVTVRVPYTDLEWIKVSPAEHRAARVEITVRFEGKKGEREFGDIWDRRVVVPTFAASRSPNTSISERRTFDLPPGRYHMRVKVSDLEGGLESSADQRIEIPDYTKIPFGFGDLELGTVDSTGGFRAVPERVFGLDVPRLAAQVTIFDRRGGDWPRRFPLRVRVIDELGGELTTTTREVSLAHSADSVVVRPAGSDLFVGDYTLSVELADPSSHLRAERTFQVEQSGPPRGKEFTEMLEPLSFIAGPAEIDHLRSLPADEQARGWEEFWRRRDPTPDSDRNEALLEFIRRVRHASRHFQGYGPGYRSDMGRIYVKFGPPDQVESRAATTQSPQQEVWYYTNPYRRFIFTDRDGFGRFLLTSGSAE